MCRFATLQGHNVSTETTVESKNEEGDKKYKKEKKGNKAKAKEKESLDTKGNFSFCCPYCVCARHYTSIKARLVYKVFLLLTSAIGVCVCDSCYF
jgi:hypothetical protein